MARDPYRYRDEKGNLLLDQLLGAEHVEHYTRILSGANEKFEAAQARLAHSVVASPPGEQDSWYSWQEYPSGPQVNDGYTMTAHGGGADLASSCQELALSPEFCWDVCGYYRDLGVHWKATKKQIRDAAIGKDPGREDYRIAYVTAQLLDPVIRAAYDRLTPGELFLGDRDHVQLIELAAVQEATRRNAEAWLNGEDYDPSGASPDVTTHEDVLNEWGFEKGLTIDEARQRLRDRRVPESEPLGSPDSALGATISPWERSWAFYKLTGPYDPYEPQQWPTARVLEYWQSMMARALSDLGVTMRFAVGIWPGRGQKVLQVGKESCIFFIGNGPITQRMATEAALATEAR